ncbi:MAG: low affinity iron permease family protein [Chitinophagaceae bacterium]|nr:low affinity iron permease family protein [Oligoflexus sp.]
MASKTASWMGKPSAFLLALIAVIVWGASGPYFHFSDTWELIINTATTIVTFLMVFLIQNTQNRDSHAFHLKLDELILAIKSADNKLIDIENCSEEQLEELSLKYRALNATAQETIQKKLETKHKKTKHTIATKHSNEE